jgi:hypothetical protein
MTIQRLAACSKAVSSCSNIVRVELTTCRRGIAQLYTALWAAMDGCRHRRFSTFRTTKISKTDRCQIRHNRIVSSSSRDRSKFTRIARGIASPRTGEALTAYDTSFLYFFLAHIAWSVPFTAYQSTRFDATMCILGSCRRLLS